MFKTQRIRLGHIKKIKTIRKQINNRRIEDFKNKKKL